MQLASTRAIVTGGVSGLGLAIAQHLVAAGAKVALFDVNDDKGAAIAAQLGDANARYFRTDVTDEAGVVANVASAKEFLGGLNAAINCAGILGAAPVVDEDGPVPLSQFQTTVMVNLVGSFNVAKAVAFLMQHNEAGEDGERGVIINIASIAAYEGPIGLVGYSASKGGVVGMTLPMAREFARFGIRVMTIAPGAFRTPMIASFPEAVQQSLEASIPFPTRMGKPEELGDLVGHILRNTYLNGETIRIDGAARLAPK